MLALWALLFLPYLSVMPGSAGDEGNWLTAAADLHAGQPTRLQLDQSFVSLAFAHLLRLAFLVAGPSLVAARAVPAGGLLAGAVAAYLLLRRLGLYRAAPVVAAGLVLHPWSVLWCRTVSISYGLCLPIGVCAPLLFLVALRSRHRVTLVLAAQLLFFAVQLSPLAVLPIAACGLYTLLTPQHRELLRRPLPWIALGLGALHAAPMVLTALRVARVVPSDQVGVLDHLGLRLLIYSRVMLTGLAGVTSVRGYTGQQPAGLLEALAAALTIALLALCWPRRGAAGQADRGARSAAAVDPPASEAQRELSRFAALFLVVALGGLPVLLVPARVWHMETVDSERYLFVALAPALLLLGGLAERRAPLRRGAAYLALAALLLIPTRQLASFALTGGGRDQGLLVVNGGGYRGWKAPRERAPLSALVGAAVDELRRDSPGAPVTVVTADYAFHSLRFLCRDNRCRVIDVRQREPLGPAGAPHLFLLWDDAVFAPGAYYLPPAPAENQKLRRFLGGAQFRDVRRLRDVVQPDGSPLLGLFAATRQ